MAKVSNSQLSCLADMRDVAEILNWHNRDLSPGDVIQRYQDAIIPIGKPSGKAYTTLFAAPISAVCIPIKLKSYKKEHLLNYERNH